MQQLCTREDFIRALWGKKKRMKEIFVGMKKNSKKKAQLWNPREKGEE